MNIDEIKAINKLKSIVKVNNDFFKNEELQTINQEEIKAIDTVLNLVNKMYETNRQHINNDKKVYMERLRTSL